RFFPLFSLLFGIGFGLMWTSARRRTSTPRIVLVRRLLALGVLGVAHQVLQPGEALLPYAAVGLLVLLPATFLPRQMRTVILVAGVVLTAVAALTGGGLVLVPGIFLIGFWLSDHVRTIDAAADRLSSGAAAAVSLGALLVGAGVVALQQVLPAIDPVVGSFALISAGCSVVVITCALRTPVGPALAAVFTPLGRLALTNYVTATLLLVLTGVGFAVNNLGADQRWPIAMVACLVILVLQAVASRLWSVTVGQGPLEAAWRWATWAGAKPAARPTDTGSSPGSVTATTGTFPVVQ
ncbi:MAG: DUF418 domain-containing protein, partial [Propionibacteriales bacterium]|nr:DUF418 domain-containing protein [Propionibacteriales bacterium]